MNKFKETGINLIRFAICDDDRLFAERFEKIVIKEFRDKCKFSEDAECVYYENALSNVR